MLKRRTQSQATQYRIVWLFISFISEDWVHEDPASIMDAYNYVSFTPYLVLHYNLFIDFRSCLISSIQISISYICVLHEDWVQEDPAFIMDAYNYVSFTPYLVLYYNLFIDFRFCLISSIQISILYICVLYVLFCT